MNLKRFTQHRKNDLIYAGACCVYAAAKVLPRTIGRFLFGALGGIGYLIPSRERDRTISHLRSVYGDRWSPEKIRKTAGSVFTNLGRNLFDAVYLARVEDDRFDRIVRHDDLGAFSRAYAADRGVIVIAAHVGCFEMLLHFFGRKGFRIFAIGREVYDKRLDRIVVNARRGGENIEYLHRTENPRTILKMLREGWVMGALIDQDTNTDGVFAPFLGRPAFTPSGPVKVAMRYGIPAFLVTTAGQRDGTHHIFIRGPLDLPFAPDFNSALVRNIERVNELIGSAIEQFPDQWVWMHQRWKHRPAQQEHGPAPGSANRESGSK